MYTTAQPTAWAACTPHSLRYEKHIDAFDLIKRNKKDYHKIGNVHCGTTLWFYNGSTFQGKPKRYTHTPNRPLLSHCGATLLCEVHHKHHSRGQVQQAGECEALHCVALGCWSVQQAGGVGHLVPPTVDVKMTHFDASGGKRVVANLWRATADDLGMCSVFKCVCIQVRVRVHSSVCIQVCVCVCIQVCVSRVYVRCMVGIKAVEYKQ